MGRSGGETAGGGPFFVFVQTCWVEPKRTRHQFVVLISAGSSPVTQPRRSCSAGMGGLTFIQDIRRFDSGLRHTAPCSVGRAP